MTQIVCIADLHGNLPDVPVCDVLLIAGDVCPDGAAAEQARWLRTTFQAWLERQPAGEIIGIWGNHDFVGQSGHCPNDLPWVLLEDSAYTLRSGLTVYGAPWTPRIGRWAFMVPLSEMPSVWRRWAEPVDILMTHGPAHGYGDTVVTGDRVGCPSLALKIAEMKPRLHVCGHIHEAHGRYRLGDTIVINASHVDLAYQPINTPVAFCLRAKAEDGAKEPKP